jgi:hypothetical protein
MLRLRIITTAAAAAALALSLSACATAGLGKPTGKDGQQQSWAAAAVEIAKDPNCGHTDDIDIMLGPISQGHVKLQRNCPVPGAKPAQDPSAGIVGH